MRCDIQYNLNIQSVLYIYIYNIDSFNRYKIYSWENNQPPAINVISFEVLKHDMECMHNNSAFG